MRKSMLGMLLTRLFLAEAPIAVDSAAVPAPTAAPAESIAMAGRVVRVFPPIEVRVLLHDLNSSQTVRLVPAKVLRSYPIERIADVLLLQPEIGRASCRERV